MRGAGRRLSPGLLLAAVAAVWVGAARDARGNGAFPDSLQILLPADHPKQIILSTTFGLILSDDDGQTWSWTCEQNNTMNAGLYQVGASPRNRLYALSGDGLAFSDDESCTWTMATSVLGSGVINDAFPDPTNPNRVFILGNAETGMAQVVSSQDFGSTFNTAIYTAPAGVALTGVESSRSNPQILYVAMFQTPGTHPRLLRSNDGGVHWNSPIDVEPALGSASFRIIAIDPGNPERIYLRVFSDLSNDLAISEDGGMTFRKPVTFSTMSAFVRLASGTILVAGQKDNAPIAYRSSDGGQTFGPWTGAPAVRALAERDGKLYVAADNFKDGFALAVSTDGGGTLRPLMTYDKVTSVRPCALAACATSCDMQVGLKLWAAQVCHPVTTPPPQPPGKSGCSLATQGRALSPTVAGLLALLVVGLSLRGRRWGKRGRGSSLRS